EEVEKESDGKITVEIHTDGQLGDDNELIEGMGIGSIDMGMIGVEPMTTLSPKLMATNLPFLFDDRETAYRVLDGELGEEMVENLPDEQNIRALGYFENGFRDITNSKGAIKKPQDLEGLDIRTPESSISLSIFESLGANPTPMDFGELYSALDQGVVDGQENPLALTDSSNFSEVQDYVSLTEHIYSPMILTISEEVWDDMPSDLQETVEDAADKAKEYEREESKNQEEEIIENLEEEIEVNEVDKEPFIEGTEKVYDELKSDIGEDYLEKIEKETD